MVKQTVAYPYHGMLLSNEKEQIIDTHRLDESPGIILSEKSQSPKGYILHLHDFTYVSACNDKITEVGVG